jgi:hypothetical protein
VAHLDRDVLERALNDRAGDRIDARCRLLPAAGAVNVVLSKVSSGTGRIIRGWNRDGKANPPEGGSACILRRAGHALVWAVCHAPGQERPFRTHACFPLAACP